jgi:hypothetical protein
MVCFHTEIPINHQIDHKSISHQYQTKKSEIAIKSCVEAGNEADQENISKSFGTTITIITHITPITTTIIIAGYIRAHLSFPFIEATFST